MHVHEILMMNDGLMMVVMVNYDKTDFHYMNHDGYDHDHDLDLDLDHHPDLDHHDRHDLLNVDFVVYIV
jgi:hypothetical protein